LLLTAGIREQGLGIKTGWFRVSSRVMVGLVQVAALAVPGFLRLGRWQVPVFGIFAAVGLVGALWLSQRTAKLVGIDEDKLWDAGMFALVAAFVASRVLLVAMDLKAFLAYPVLVLALPSLTYGGMALTAGLVWIYLRWKKLPVLDVMDAWAPCAALLAAVLSLGHFFEGTDAGMPTRLPWGVVTLGDHVLGRVHPVQLYALVAALGICEWTLIRLKRRKRAGEAAGLALVAGGVVSFLLDMMSQPVDSFGEAWLDPSQWVALGAVLCGAWILVAGLGERGARTVVVAQNAGVLHDPGSVQDDDEKQSGTAIGIEGSK